MLREHLSDDASLTLERRRQEVVANLSALSHVVVDRSLTVPLMMLLPDIWVSPSYFLGSGLSIQRANRQRWKSATQNDLVRLGPDIWVVGALKLGFHCQHG